MIGLGILVLGTARTVAVFAQQPAAPPVAAPSPATPTTPSAEGAAPAALPGSARGVAPQPLPPSEPLPPPEPPPIDKPVPPTPGAPAPAVAPQAIPSIPALAPSAPPPVRRAKVRPAGSGVAGLYGTLSTPAVAGTTLDVDINADPQSAVNQYQAFVNAFDSQREAAAHAVFGLGEACRKLGRMDEARAQYGRILREFVDFPDLARQSQKLLAENVPSRATASNRGGGGGADESNNEQVLAEERDLVLQEMKLLEAELEQTKARISQGVEPTASALPIQREILQLKQRLLRLGKDEPKTPPPVSRGR